MNLVSPLSKDLVLVGGGHTHALVLRGWGMAPLAGVRLTLINPGPTAPYTGMLPGYIAGHYTQAETLIDLVRLARFAGARIVFDKACGIDREAKLVRLEGRPPVRYDLLSIDVGATAALPGIAGFAEHAQSVKPLGAFADAWQSFVEDAGSKYRAANCVVVGAGIAGVELALAMAHRMQTAQIKEASVTLIEARPEVLPGSGSAVRRALLDACSRYGIKLLTGAQITRVGGDSVSLSDGRALPADFVVSATGARAYPWLADAGLAQTGGFVDVGPDLRSISDGSIFAAGDCAHLTHAPRPKAGVFAVREAPVLLHNLKAALSGTPSIPYNPQSDYLKLISLGEPSAVGQKHSVTLSGRWLWQLKDDIDRKFMRRLSDLPAMPEPKQPQIRALDPAGEALHEPLCGGCGSKVGQASLAVAFKHLPASARADTVSGIGDDAAVLRTGERLQVISTDHLRAFIEDPYLLARIAAVHALGDVWAMGAAPQAALLSVIIPRMSEPMQAATLSEIVSAVHGVLSEAGADLVGGHTSMGQELTIGLTVTGLLDCPAIGLASARPGDVLILTKPIGTGVILAGDMRGLTRGDEVVSALTSMQRPLGKAAAILARSAHAMTDVTGFGLAGHLINILDAAGVAARLSLSDLPLIDGAERLAAEGVRSSIWPANASLDARVKRPATPLSDLIYDPQTAGGLLAAVPASSAADILAALHSAGEPAWQIGEIESGAPSLTVS